MKIETIVYFERYMTSTHIFCVVIKEFGYE